MRNVTIVSHPLVQHKLSILRSKETDMREFRGLVRDITILMGYEVTKDISLEEIDVETPLGFAKGVVSDREMVLVPVLRAGLGMVEGMLGLVPWARVGHIGLYRDHDTLEPREYYYKLPGNIAKSDVILLEPMLATGGSASVALDFLRKNGAVSVKLMCLVASRQGIKRIRRYHPDVRIFCCAVDEELNNRGYIVPGLGDAGDRLFGTY